MSRPCALTKAFGANSIGKNIGCPGSLTMRIRLVCFILLLFSSCFGFAQLQVTVFTGVSLGCSKTVIAPNSTIDIGSLQVGTNARRGALPDQYRHIRNNGHRHNSYRRRFQPLAQALCCRLLFSPARDHPSSQDLILPHLGWDQNGANQLCGRCARKSADVYPEWHRLHGFWPEHLVPGDNTHTVTAGQAADYQ